MAAELASAVALGMQKLAEIGGMIRAARHAKGLTQEGLASRHGISRLTLLKIEDGRPGVNWLTIAVLCADLDLAMDSACRG